MRWRGEGSSTRSLSPPLQWRRGRSTWWRRVQHQWSRDDRWTLQRAYVDDRCPSLSCVCPAGWSHCETWRSLHWIVQVQWRSYLLTDRAARDDRQFGSAQRTRCRFLSDAATPDTWPQRSGLVGPSNTDGCGLADRIWFHAECCVSQQRTDSRFPALCVFNCWSARTYWCLLGCAFKCGSVSIMNL